MLKMRVVTGYHWLPEFWSQGGYRLPLVTRISVSGWLPVTTGYQIGRYRPELHPPVTGYHRLPECIILAGYRLQAVTKKSKFFWLPAGYHCNQVTG